MPDDKNKQPQAPERARINPVYVILIGVIIVCVLVPFLAEVFSGIGVTTFTTLDFYSKINDTKTFITNASIGPYGQLMYIEGTVVTLDPTGRVDDIITFRVVGTENEINNSDRFPLLNTAEGVNLKTFVTGETCKLDQRLMDEVTIARRLPSTTWAGTRLDSKNFNFNTDVSKLMPGVFEQFLALMPQLALYAAGALIVFYLLTKIFSQVNRGNTDAMSFNNSRARLVSKSRVKFTDVAGCDEEKAELVEVVDYLKNPRKFTDFGAKMPKGILLVGPPGTGKTLLAKATAGEAGVPFYSISGSDFVEMFVGVGAGRVRDMFKKAKSTAPCIVFIDEIDAVGRQRGAGLGGGNDEREQTLNQLLVEMDGFSDNSGIIIIAATNREDVLDPALLRAGRFDRQITVNLPDKAGREAIFHVHARGKKFADDIDFKILSSRTVGYSGADIENILNEAAVLAVRGNKTAIDMTDVDEAIDRRFAGPAKKSSGMTVHERKIVAYHEAGHAIIGLKVPHSDKVQKITIIPRGRTGGHVLMTPEDDRFILTKNELIARIIGFLGGRSSEEVFFEDISTGAQNDIEVATRIARMMVTELGMSSLGPIQYERESGSVFLGRDYTSSQKNFSARVADEIDSEIRKIIAEAHSEAVRIITKHKDEVIKIAETLLQKETITAEEIDGILKGPSPEVEPAKVAKPRVTRKKTEDVNK